MLAKPKYRRRLPARLGFGLKKHFSRTHTTRPTFWVHGLSVGEITSAVPLVVGLRKRYPDSRIVVTASTETGEAVAKNLLTHVADHIVGSPLDILPVVARFIRYIQPDLFILIETDFWPNLLTSLARRDIPSFLVNGRISQKSFDAYRKFSFFFVPMFRSFNHICMQTETDREKMKTLGVHEAQLHTLGNLKYDTPAQTAASTSRIAQLLPEDRLIFVAGSTHQGEERIILEAYRKLRCAHPQIYLVLVPRNPERTDEILHLGKTLQQHGVKRSEDSDDSGDYLLVDTIGELVELYRYCHIAFVGGSLVAEGGHNPIEPAIMSVPVLFGPHMEDFHEIAADLVAAQGASVITAERQLTSTLSELIVNDSLRSHMGRCASACITAQQGVITRHIDLISLLL